MVFKCESLKVPTRVIAHGGSCQSFDIRFEIIWNDTPVEHEMTII